MLPGKYELPSVNLDNQKQPMAPTADLKWNSGFKEFIKGDRTAGFVVVDGHLRSFSWIVIVDSAGYREIGKVIVVT